MQIQRKLSAKQTVSRTGQCTGAKLSYQVNSPDNLDRSSEALELVRNTAPAYVGSARKQNIELVKIPGNGTYEFEVNYTLPEAVEEKVGNERIWTFEVKNHSVRVFDAKELVRIYPGNPKIVPPDPGTRIGWDGRMDGDSGIEGALVNVPELKEICVATYFARQVNTAFRKNLFPAHSTAGRRGKCCLKAPSRVTRSPILPEKNWWISPTLFSSVRHSGSKSMVFQSMPYQCGMPSGRFPAGTP